MIFLPSGLPSLWWRRLQHKQRTGFLPSVYFSSPESWVSLSLMLRMVRRSELSTSWMKQRWALPVPSFPSSMGLLSFSRSLAYCSILGLRALNSMRQAMSLPSQMTRSKHPDSPYSDMQGSWSLRPCWVLVLLTESRQRPCVGVSMEQERSVPRNSSHSASAKAKRSSCSHMRVRSLVLHAEWVQRGKTKRVERSVVRSSASYASCTFVKARAMTFSMASLDITAPCHKLPKMARQMIVKWWKTKKAWEFLLLPIPDFRPSHCPSPRISNAVSPRPVAIYHILSTRAYVYINNVYTRCTQKSK